MAAGEYSFTWKIENFTFCPKKNGEYLSSPPFTTENIGDSIWIMVLYPKGFSKDSKEYVSLCIRRFHSDIRSDESNIEYIIEIVPPDGSNCLLRKNENILLARGKAWGWKKLCKIQDMAEEMQKWKEDTLTICCTLINRKQLICEAKTKIYVDQCIFKWNVTLQNGVIQEIRKEFALCDSCEFYLKLYSIHDDIEIFVYRKQNNIAFSKLLSCRISLLDVNGSEVESKRVSYLFGTEDSDVWKLPNFLNVKRLEDNKKTWLKNSIFILNFEFSSSKGKDPVYVLNPVCNNFSEKHDMVMLRENLSNMYSAKIHSDVELKLGGKSFQAHKSVLASRSPVFKAMFDQDMRENQSGIVNIDDVEADTFEQFLEYIYTARIENMDYESACNLLILADRYEISSLKISCAQVLKSHLSIDNVCEVLNLSDLVSYDQLKAFIIDFISEHAKEILTSLEWEKLSENNSKLAKEVKSTIGKYFNVSPKM